MANSAYIYQGTQDNFATLVLENSNQGPVLVNFWAPYAGPCHKLHPVLEKLAQDYSGRFLLVNVNTVEQKPLPREYGVRSVPTLKLFRYGKVVEDIHGPQPEADLRKVLDKYVARPSDKIVSAAVQRYASGDVAEAMRLMQEAERADPDNPRIPMTLAKLLMRHGEYTKAEELLNILPKELQEAPEISILFAHMRFLRVAQEAPPFETLEQRIAANPNDSEARYQLSAIKLMQDDYAGAMEHLLELIRRDRAYGNEAGRKGLLAIFDILGGRGELVDRYRALMFNALH
jgi:putative thioredoxin